MNKIKYPLIVISEKEGLVFVVDKYEELRTTSKRIVNEGYFENLLTNLFLNQSFQQIPRR